MLDLAEFEMAWPCFLLILIPKNSNLNRKRAFNNVECGIYNMATLTQLFKLSWLHGIFPHLTGERYQNPREASSRSRILLISLVYVCICVFIYLCNCVTPPSQTKKDTDLKFGTHTPIDLI